MTDAFGYAQVGKGLSYFLFAFNAQLQNGKQRKRHHHRNCSNINRDETVDSSQYLDIA